MHRLNRTKLILSSMIAMALSCSGIIAAELATPATISSSTGANDAPGGSNVLRVAGGLTNRVATGTFANLFGDNISPNLGAAGVGPWYPGTTVFGSSGSDKVIIGYLQSNSSRATVGGHRTALNDWAPLSMNGSELEFRILETVAARVQANHQFVIGNNVKGGLSVTGSSFANNDAQIEIGRTDGVRASSYIDFHAGANSDYEARIIREPRANGRLAITNTGGGSVQIKSNSSPIACVFDPADGTALGEGGEISLTGQGAYQSINVDNYWGGLRVYSGGVEWLRLNQSALIIGNEPGGTGKLRVDGGGDFKGTVRAQEVVVTLNGWPDSVFSPEYHLAPLSKVAEQIELLRHLPGIPSESEILEKGLSMGEMQRLHMEKIEELTLYAIDADRTCARQQVTIDILQNQVARQQAQIDEILKRLTVSTSIGQPSP